MVFRSLCGVAWFLAPCAVLGAVLGASGCHGDTASSPDDTTGGSTSSGAASTSASGPSEPTTTDAPPDTSADSGSTGMTPPDLPPEPAPVTINEVMPDNDSTLNGPDGFSTPDWVELVNTGDESIALTRVGLRNAANDSWTGTAADGEIAPGEHLLVWLGTPVGDGGIWTGWSVAKEYDGLVLTFDGHDAEQIAWAVLGDDISSMRLPDATGEFVSTAWPTPAEVNAELASPTLDSAQETVFLTDVVHRIDFVVTPEISAMLDQPDRPEVHVEATIDGIRYADLGLKPTTRWTASPASSWT
jgi:Lamin Tail Domain